MGVYVLKIFYINAQSACKLRQLCFLLYNLDIFNVLTFSILFNRNKNEHLCLAPNLRKKPYSKLKQSSLHSYYPSWRLYETGLDKYFLILVTHDHTQMKNTLTNCFKLRTENQKCHLIDKKKKTIKLLKAKY